MTAFIEGMTRALDITGAFPRRKLRSLDEFTNDNRSTQESVTDAIAGYWQSVGGYLYTAIEEYERGEKEGVSRKK